ncbi:MULTISPECIES: hypothetical protein [unclassified Streptomyces]|uniref:hypothetical protein n=1 Tax=unclassified Streptomyces TaxID=2593676 RepID=UPI0016602ED9|nr:MULTISPECIES: hypothetical protein [unclassified Streptomyces]MBD0711782.1 hypothetical protein [Streptomyces sp. CBMA291]MBD0714772.1 hypothetical protein [Streptomyces sp. CBMA370]
MDAVRVALLREVLAGTEWPGAARRFAGALRSSVVPRRGGLLLVGTEAYEPWHLAAHLVDEAAWSGLPELAPTLVRHRVRPDAPAHLAVGLGRLEAAGRGATLLVVAPERPDEGLLQRVYDARRAGATVLSLDGGDTEVRGLAHEALTVAEGAGVDLDMVQHLVSAAAGENSLPSPRADRRFRDRLSSLTDRLTSPPPTRW